MFWLTKADFIYSAFMFFNFINVRLFSLFDFYFRSIVFFDRVAPIKLYARRIFRYLSANSRVILVRVPLL